MHSASAMSSSSSKPQCSTHIQGAPSILATFNQDIFVAFIIAVNLSPYKDAFPTLPFLFFFDSARDLISLDTAQYSGGFSSSKLPQTSMVMKSSPFSMTRDALQEVIKLFLDAGLLEHAQQHFNEEPVYYFTLFGLDILNRFIHENSNLQNFLKALLGTTSTQTAAVPLTLIASMGAEYFMQAGLIRDTQDILSTTFSDDRVYQFTLEYSASVDTFKFPSGRRVEEDEGVITRVCDAPKET